MLHSSNRVWLHQIYRSLADTRRTKMFEIPFTWYGFVIRIKFLASALGADHRETVAHITYDPPTPPGINIPKREWESPAPLTMRISCPSDLQRATRLLLGEYTPPEAVASLWPGIFEQAVNGAPASWIRFKESQ